VFLSADKVQGNWQGMNPYGYVDGNPETKSDPSGKMIEGQNGEYGNIDSQGNLHLWIPFPLYGAGDGYNENGNYAYHTFHYARAELHQPTYRPPPQENMLQQVLDGLGTFFAHLAARMSLQDPSCGLMLSFAPTTKVATSQGEKAISSLHPGEKVWAYNPKTHKMELQPIVHVWINHDHDLVDLTIRSTTPAQHGKAVRTTNEVIHTNKKHPFLTAEKGFVPVSQLRIGMHVLNAGGGVGTITMLKTVPGTMTMYNLEIAQDHTYAIGEGQWIVHNCDSGPVSGSDEDPTDNITMQDILNNPQLLRNLSPQQVELIAARDGGWVTGPLRKSQLPGETFNQLNPKGTAFTDKYIQWHAGGGRHGPNPYWKVSTNQGIVRVDYEGPTTTGGDIEGGDIEGGGTIGGDIPDVIEP
jgi:hypothetical protein